VRYSCRENENNEIGEECGTYGGDEIRELGFDGGKPEGSSPLGRPSRRWIILKWIVNKYDAGLGWIELAQERDKWRAIVNTAMNLRAP
jgi:hypothetical protein